MINLVLLVMVDLVLFLEKSTFSSHKIDFGTYMHYGGFGHITVTVYYSP